MLAPQDMAKRMDQTINRWHNSLRINALANPPSFIRLSQIPTLAIPSHMQYMPGRSQFHPDLRVAVQRRLKAELRMMTDPKMHGLIPEELGYLFEHAWNTIWQSADEFNLPFLLVERGLQDLLRTAFWNVKPDLYAEQKQSLRKIVIEELKSVKREIDTAENPLAKSLDFALAGNIFGRAETQAAFEGRLDPAKALRNPLSYYCDMRRAIVAKLEGNPLNIVYVLDNAGEASLDLLFIEQLMQRGHSVILIAKLAPVMNDETWPAIIEVATHLKLEQANLRIFPGWDIPGVDFSSMEPALRKAFENADMTMVKGEGNFEGMPPDHEYSFDTVYLLMSKTAGLYQQLPGFDAPPTKGEALAYLKPASLKRP